MTLSAQHLPRPVVVYFFVQPTQRLVRWNYPHLRAAKKDWHISRLLDAANRVLKPWMSESSWHYHQSEYRMTHQVTPVQGIILRYAGGALVPSQDIQRTPRRKPRRQKHTIDRPSERSVAKRLRHQQRLDDMDPGVRPGVKVHRTYYEDTWSIRRSERGWKAHRTTQWKA